MKIRPYLKFALPVFEASYPKPYTVKYYGDDGTEVVERFVNYAEAIAFISAFPVYVAPKLKPTKEAPAKDYSLKASTDLMKNYSLPYTALEIREAKENAGITEDTEQTTLEALRDDPKAWEEDAEANWDGLKGYSVKTDAEHEAYHEAVGSAVTFAQALDAQEVVSSKPIFDFVESDFYKISYSIAKVLTAKDKAYGSSALSPIMVFNGKCKVGQRLDDKISRIKNSDTIRKNDIADLLGYLILTCKELGFLNFDDQIE